MALAGSAIQELYTRRIDEYALFINMFQSPKGVEAVLREMSVLQGGLHVLDAGCGYGMASLALIRALKARRLNYERIDAFDLTGAMLERFKETIETQMLSRIRLCQADVLVLETLPRDWSSYELVMAASMLEYLPKKCFVRALAALRERMLLGGRLLVLITKKTLESKLLIQWWWRAECYNKAELSESFHRAGFRGLRFHRFPLRYFWLNRVTYAIEAWS